MTEAEGDLNKLTSTWDAIRVYLRRNPRCDVVVSVEGGVWLLRLVRDLGDCDESELREETGLHGQDAPCPVLIADWCRAQMCLAR